jgi:hypothetical protein
MRGKVLAGVRHARGKIRHYAIPCGCGVTMDLIGNSAEQGAQVVSAFAGILAMGADPRSGIIKPNAPYRRAGRTGVGDPARQPAKFTASDYRACRRGSERRTGNKRLGDWRQLGQMRVKICASLVSLPAP